MSLNEKVIWIGMTNAEFGKGKELMQCLLEVLIREDIF